MARAKQRFVFRLLVLIVLLGVCSAGHFVTHHGKTSTHEFLFKVTYVPIVLAGLWFGVKGGLATSAATSVLYLLHVKHQLGGQLLTGNLGPTLDILLYNAIAFTTGLLSQAQHRARREAERLAEERTALHARVEASYQALQRRTRDLLETEDQLRRAERMAALGELAASLAHEIRNPLSGISGAAEIVSRPDVTPETQAEFSAILHKEATQLNKVVHDFLDFARARMSESQETDVEELVSGLCDLLRQEATQSSVEIVREIPASLHIEADPILLRHVLLNLLLNAIQAMPRGGTVTVSAALANDRLLLKVRDTGDGMAREVQERVFTPFFTTRPNGTGLGLAIAHRITRGLGGEINVESEPGQGTEFAVSLPLKAPQVSLADIFSSQAEPADNGQEDPAG